MPKPLSVLFIIPSLSGGGAERVITTLVCHMDRARFKISLAVVDMRNAVFRAEIPEDVELIDLGCQRVRHALPRLIQLLWQRKPDLVFSTLSHLNVALAVLRPLLPNSSRYLARETVVVSRFLSHYRWPALWAWAYRHFYHRFDKIICQSRDMRDDLVEHFAVPPGKTVVIHNPLDKERIQDRLREPLATGYASDRVNLVAVGRLMPQKGFDLLIEALAQAGRPDLHLTILGEGTVRGELEQQIEVLGLSCQVRLLGFKPNPYPFIAQADTFVLSSRYEGFPNVVLEALACGTPVLALPAPGGIDEILAHLDGCKVTEQFSVASLAAALRAIEKGKRLDSSVCAPYSCAHITELYQEQLNMPG